MSECSFSSLPSSGDFCDRRRLLGVTLLLFALFSLLIIRFYWIQVVQGELWEKRGNKQHYMVVDEPFHRGKFWSNVSLRKNHHSPPFPFVIDIPAFHLYVDPQSVPQEHREAILQAMAEILSPSEEELLRMRHQFSRKKSRARLLLSFLSKEKKGAWENWWLPFSRKHRIVGNALFYEKDYLRSYPGKTLLGQVLHTIRRRKDQKTGRGIPTGGLEESLNEYLQGKIGKRRIIRSVRQHPLNVGEITTTPENGADIYLTVNHHLQAMAEEELERGVTAAKARSGWCVAMNPYTGEILVLAQYPFFSPEQYEEYYNDPEKMEQTRVNAVMQSYEPGSIIKPLTLAICLQANEELIRRGETPLFHPDEKLFVGNGVFPGRSKVISEHSGRYHQYLNMYHALQRSSNVYMGRVIERLINRLGDSWYQTALSDFFGFGKRSGIELDGEEGGLLPQIGKYHPNGRPEWSKDTPYSLAFGHNLLVNSIQMVRAYSILANGGRWVNPTLIRKIVKKEHSGKWICLLDAAEKREESNAPQILSKEVTEQIMQAMRFMSLSGKFSNIPGYTEAGKSGTASKIFNGQYSKRKYFSSFITIAPALQPRFVLLVSLDEPSTHFIAGVGNNYYGSVCAAPIATQIAQRMLHYLGVAEDDPYDYPIGDWRRDENRALLLKELQELNALYAEWNTP